MMFDLSMRLLIAYGLIALTVLGNLEGFRIGREDLVC